jgi:hypothetical protein
MEQYANRDHAIYDTSQIQANQHMMARGRMGNYSVTSAAAQPLSDYTGLPSCPHFPPAVITIRLSTVQQRPASQGHSLLGHAILPRPITEPFCEQFDVYQLRLSSAKRNSQKSEAVRVFLTRSFTVSSKFIKRSIP